ncbi:MAG: hypothetical protein JST91_01800 [Actinobacteria bacterium]|nr:hypothetical protein [Actinomycetota bacterium]
MGATFLSARRLIVAGAFAAAAAAAPTIAAVAVTPAVPAQLADCPAGEEGDIYTTTCVPMLVPNSPAAATPPAPVDVTVPSNTPCPPGVTGGECASSAEGQVSAPAPQMPGQVQPGQPEEELQQIDTPDY